VWSPCALTEHPRALSLRIGSVNILTVDVEDWFHILEVEGTPDLEAWSGLESRVERGTERLLELFEGAGAKVTWFFLGWVAERHPKLVERVAQAGHEVACHGYAHQLVYTQSPDAFGEDIRRAKAILEDAAGAEVLGYRAPGFSITPATPWAFEEIAAAGFHYDSSVFPGPRGHGGLPGAPLGPYRIETSAGSLSELPVSVVALGPKRLCFFGGGYLRITPYPLIRAMTSLVNLRGRPVVYYVHPREVDPEHPRLEMSALRRFKSYVNLDTTEAKLRALVRDQRLGTMRAWLLEHESQLEARSA
jgi:polysaccharide deacetylase family protein (PEP-CTERM system associated)